MIKTEKVKKSFWNGKDEKIILHNINLNIEKGSCYTIVGPSGTGKSTLLNCISGLLPPDEGTVLINDVNIYRLKEKELSDFRRKHIGFVFQDFKLLPHYSVLDNVMLPLIYESNLKELKEKAKKLLQDVGISESLFNRLPESLSGGEKQRVAIARSLINDPLLLLCDEPTGNLDTETRNQIIQLLNEVKGRGQTIVIVTHDEEVAKMGDRCLRLNNSELKELVLNA